MSSNLNLALKIEADIKQAQAALASVQQQIGSITGSAKNAGSAAGGAAGGFNQLGAAASGAAGNLNQAAQSATGVKGALSTAATALKAFVGAAVAIQAVKGVIALADEYGQMASRIKMATASAEEYEQVQMRLLDTANNTYRPLSEIQEAYIRTADALRSLGYNTHQAVDVSDSLSYLFVTNATSADRASSAIDAFGKSLQTGKVQADQWQTLLAAVPSLVDDIAAAGGKSAEEIRKLGAEGKLSVAMLTEGLRQSTEKNKQLAADMPITVADAFTKLKNSLEAFFGEVNSGTGLTQILVGALEGVGEAIDWLTGNLETAAIQFEGWGEDIRRIPESVTFLVDGIRSEMDGLLGIIGINSGQISDFLIGAFKDWPLNVRQFIQIITVEIAAFVDKCKAFGVDIANFLNPVAQVKSAYAQFKGALNGEVKTFASIGAEFDKINDARRDSLQAIYDERAATESNVEASKKEAAAKREALKAEIERQRNARVNLKTPTSTGGKAKADPVAQALAQQEQSLTVALAEANQKLANAKNGVADADHRAANRLEIWLQTNKNALALSAAQIDRLKTQAAAVDAAAKAYADLAEAKARAERIKSGMEDIQITLLEAEGNRFEASRQRIEKQYRALVKDLNDSGDTVNLDIVTQVKNYEVAKAQLDDVLAKIDAIEAAQGRNEQSISTEMETGLITEVEGRERILGIHRQTYAALEKLRPLLAELAAQPGIVGQQAAAALQQLNDQQKRLQATTTLFSATLKNGLTSGLQQAITGLADGTMTLRDAIHALATEVAQSLLKMYADNAIQALMKPDGPLAGFLNMGDSGAGGAGGFLGALFGNGAQSAMAATTTANTASVTANTAAITTLTAGLTTSGLTNAATNVAADAVGAASEAAETASIAALMTAATSLTAAATMLLTSATALQAAAAAISASSAAGGGMGALGSLGSGVLGSMFASGGYTGAGAKYQPAGVVHAGEFVARQEVVRQPGALQFLSAFNRQGMQAIEAYLGRGYADGGFVAPLPTPRASLASMSLRLQPVSISAGNTAVDNKIALNLFDDPSRMADAIRSPQGEKAFSVLLSRNPQKFRQLLGV
ncbi:MAG: tape measure protein [Zoogloeaceae bacterium]|jgi:tape measure domain-containing protein|nr:tape measure protein [Zoogloeaceae bacterium]